MRAMPSTSGGDPKLEKLCLRESRLSWPRFRQETMIGKHRRDRGTGHLVLVLFVLSYHTRLRYNRDLRPSHLLAILSQSMKTCQNLSLNVVKTRARATSQLCISQLNPRHAKAGDPTQFIPQAKDRNPRRASDTMDGPKAISNAKRSAMKWLVLDLTY